MGIEQSPDLSCQCSASDPRQLNPGCLEFDYHLCHFHLRTSKIYTIILLHTNWYLFAYSHFAYSRFA